jgi:hypothetical protein
VTNSIDKSWGIRTDAVELSCTATFPGGLFSAPQKQTKTWKVLDTRTLVKTLRVIQDGATEAHVKSNLQKLIDQVYDGRFDE